MLAYRHLKNNPKAMRLRNMPHKDKAKQKKGAKEHTKRILAAHNLKIEKVTRDGPRFFVAICKKGKERFIFKTCIYTKTFDHLTNSKFAKEVLFLFFLKDQDAKYHFLNQSTPKIFDGNTYGRTWYLREYIDGQIQNIGSGTVRFKPSFFTDSTQKWILEFYRELAKIKSTELPDDLADLIKAQSNLKKTIYYINLGRKHIIKHFDEKKFRKIISYLRTKIELYNSTKRTLSHHEPYAPHFIKRRSSKFVLIDWENLGPSHPVNDISMIWMRCASHPKWQAKLLSDFRKQWPSPHAYNEIWEVKVLVQSLFNIMGIEFAKNKTDFKPLADFSKECLERFLKGEKLY